VYLPPGVWHDFWTESMAQGGRRISRTVDLATTPLYVRAGAIVPFGPLKQYTGEPVDGPLELVVYPGADGDGSVYEDDGHSLGYQRGEWMRILTAWNDAARVLSLRLAEGSQLRQPMPRRIVVRVAPDETTREVVFDGSPVEVSL
jgi:alpha-glucosidase (family GH31 glycosyl hydrolase)